MGQRKTTVTETKGAVWQELCLSVESVSQSSVIQHREHRGIPILFFFSDSYLPMEVSHRANQNRSLRAQESSRITHIDEPSGTQSRRRVELGSGGER